MVEPNDVLNDGHRETVAVRLGVGHGASAYPNPIKATQPLSRYVEGVRRVLPITVRVRGILAAPAISRPAALSLERAGLEFREVQALPSAIETAAQPALF